MPLTARASAPGEGAGSRRASVGEPGSRPRNPLTQRLRRREHRHRSRARYRLPRELHPGAWWAWAVLLAATASQTTNPLLLVLLAVVVTLVVLARRGDGPWARSFWLYLVLAGFIVVARLLYRVVLGGAAGGPVLLALPELGLPGGSGITLLGDVTADAVGQALQDGLRLGCVVVCVGAANALANPKRLLAALPGALYEIGTALVIAVSVFSQLAESVLRVRRARALRSVAARPEPHGATPHGPGGRRGRRQRGRRQRVVRGVVVPVLTDALDRSIQLAASMDARGYGRTSQVGRTDHVLTTALVLGGLVGLAFGAYASVSAALPRLLTTMPGGGLDVGWLVLVAGAVLAVLGLRRSGRTVVRTRYLPQRMRAAEWLVVLSGFGCFLLVRSVLLGPGAGVLVPSVRAWPTLTPVLGVALLLAVVPALATPAPPTGGPPPAAVPTPPGGAPPPPTSPSASNRPASAAGAGRGVGRC